MSAPTEADMPTLPQHLMNVIAEYGMARTDGVSEVERLHRWETVIRCIKTYALACVVVAPATPTMSDALAAGEGTLHNAIDHWQAEAELLTSVVAECRDAFSMPPPGHQHEVLWGAAMGDPESVPLYIAARVNELEDAAARSDDAALLDWVIRQGEDFRCAVIVDAPGDGEYRVCGMDDKAIGQGKTGREAIRAAKVNAP